jgi:predicted ABC-type ATPase
VGEFLAAKGGAYFNPDLVARELIQKGVPTEQANASAWKLGFNALQRAINNNGDFSFETTLGGNGGHEIREAKIRERYPKSLAKLVSFIGAAAEVHVFDNSAESADGLPRTVRVFRMRGMVGHHVRSRKTGVSASCRIRAIQTRYQSKRSSSI